MARYVAHTVHNAARAKLTQPSLPSHRCAAEHRVWRHFFPPSDAEEGKHVDDDEDKDSEAKVSPAPSAELPKLTAGEDAQK